MKKLLLMLTVFAFATVMAASSSRSCSGYLVDQNMQFVSQAHIYCEQTNSSVITGSDGSFSNLSVLPNSTNTLKFTSSTGQSLGSQEITVQGSDMRDVILQTGNFE